MTIGIERLVVYVPVEAVQVETIAAARGTEVGNLAAVRGRRAFAVAASCEDVVTLAATAGARVLRAGNLGRNQVGLLLVASATATPAMRPVASYVHGLLGLSPRCRAVDIEAGNVAGTNAVMLAQQWVQAGGFQNRCALVITADVVRPRPGAAREWGQGAAAVALVVGFAPQVLLLPDDGIPATAGSGGDPHSYRAALSSAFEVFRHGERPVLEAGEALTDRLASVLYRASSPASAIAAHRHVLRLDWQASAGRWPATAAEVDTAMAAAVAAQVEPWMQVATQFGNGRCSSVWLALAGLIEAHGRRLGGRRVGIFAFDRRTGGEFLSGLVPAAIATVADTGLAASLAERVWLTGEQYAARANLVAGGDPPTGFAGDFRYVTTRRGRRVYVACGPPTD
jgi:hydroxymethylglutaryl-CoA synthase